MFTSEPSLAQRIERMIGDTPIVDPYSQIGRDQPGAPDLAALMSDRRVVAGLIASGMPPGDFDPALPPDERVRRSIPYLGRMRNTAAAWCLFRIFRDLYDFGEPNLTGDNYRALFDKVVKTGQDPDWARSVLRGKTNIRTVVTGLDQRGPGGSMDPDPFYYRLDVHSLLRPEPTEKGEDDEVFDNLIRERPTTTGRLERLVFDRLDRTVIDRVRFSSMFLPVGHRFRPPDEANDQLILNPAGDDRQVSNAEGDRIASFVRWSVLKWHHENKKAIQFVVGDEPLGDGQGIPRSRETWASEMAHIFRRFGGARFGLMMASNDLGQDDAALAGQLPNVYASGDWSHGLASMTIERDFGLRVQMVPMIKVVGFSSDASYVEWGYGKLQLVRKAMAAALARLVDARFFEEDEIPPLLRQVLNDTPRDLYDLGES